MLFYCPLLLLLLLGLRIKRKGKKETKSVDYDTKSKKESKILKEKKKMVACYERIIKGVRNLIDIKRKKNRIK